MEKPIEWDRTVTGGWYVTYRGYTAASRATFLGALYGAWYYRRLDHPGRKIKWGEIPGRGGKHGFQVQWAPRRWVLFYRLDAGRVRAVWTRRAAPLDLAAADDMRFEKFTADADDAARDLFDDPTTTRYRLRTDTTPGPWQTFTWGGGPVPPGPRGERHSWPDDAPDPGDDIAG